MALERKQALLRAAAVALVVLVLDQLSKAVVRASIERGEEVDVMFGLHLVNVRNRGVAFGLLADGRAVVLATVAAALCLLIAWFLLARPRPWAWLATGLLLGGALGNVIDRLTADAVTDFIDLPLWPAFNVADIAITLGVVALVLTFDTKEDDAAPGGGG